ncbi:hypothetical protein DPMN_090731 [Dreissena polymorpha]|uniref:Uncharacterized protein n=1 Tax=Dreissena polymorpha TaxID=45954 RepID=A0A9D4R021_DREPO|nr:hypothetical protein DPMN_090731 [Dreissena polymorpha]
MEIELERKQNQLTKAQRELERVQQEVLQVTIETSMNRGLMRVRKLSSQISLCSLHRLIRYDTFSLNWIIPKKKP